MRIALYSGDGKLRIPKSHEQNAALSNMIVLHSQSIWKSMQNETSIKISVVFQLQKSADIKHFLFSSIARASFLGTVLLGSVEVYKVLNMETFQLPC